MLRDYGELALLIALDLAIGRTVLVREDKHQYLWFSLELVTRLFVDLASSRGRVEIRGLIEDRSLEALREFLHHDRRRLVGII